MQYLISRPPPAPEPRIVAPRKHHHNHQHQHHIYLQQHQLPVQQQRHVPPVEYEEQQIAYLDPDDNIYDNNDVTSDVTGGFFLNEFVLGSAEAATPAIDTPRSADVLSYGHGIVNDGFTSD